MGNERGRGRAVVIVLMACIALCVAAGLLLMIDKEAKEPVKAQLTEAATDEPESETPATTQAARTTEQITEAEDPNEQREEIIADILDGMSVEEKIGQMFFVRASADFDQSTFDTYHPGGLLLFGQDVDDKTYEEVQEYIAGFQSMSDVLLFIGIDEEGGTVSRVSGNPNLVSEPFESPRQLYAEGGMEAVIAGSHAKSALLLDLGMNVNFAPVLDFSTDSDDFIYDRAFGDSIDETEEFATQIVEAMRSDGMGMVLKHFPGYGSNGDTHTNIITDNRDFETFESCDFLPFEAGIQAGAQCVLVCHNIVTCMDSDWPASLSPRVHEVLRDTLDFDGVIITDDLAMDGVADFCGEDTAAVQAITAGNDMMIVSDFEQQYEAVLAAVEDGTIDEERLNESVTRILRWKYELGLIYM